MVNWRLLILSVFFLSHCAFAHAVLLPHIMVDYTHVPVEDDGITEEFKMQDTFGNIEMHQTFQDPNFSRIRDEKNVGRLSEDELVGLRNAVLAADVFNLQDSYSNCGVASPYSEVTFTIGGQDKTITVYEPDEETLKTCTAPPAPEALKNAIKNIKDLLGKYKTPLK